MDLQTKSVYQNVELRKVSEGALAKIIQILEENDVWKSFINNIPESLHSLNSNFKHKYTDEHVRLIESHSKKTGRRCTEILLEEWSTSGRIRPTLNTLKDVLAKSEIFKAADLIADMLKEPRPPRPVKGPGAPINTSVSELMRSDSIDKSSDGNNYATKQMNSNTNINDSSLPNLSLMRNSTAEIQNSNNNNSVMSQSYNVPVLSTFLDKSHVSGASSSTSNDDSSISSSVEHQMSLPHVFGVSGLQSSSSEVKEKKELVNFTNESLNTITNNFKNKIGNGGFGDVFIGSHEEYGLVAVKKINQNIQNYKDITTLYSSEVKMLSQFNHKNIVPIIGFSTESFCIVCEYIDGGSLTANLAKKYLTEDQRIRIMLGTAEGMAYLHSGVNNSSNISDKSQLHPTSRFLHGDIKSDNILLTKDLTPKLCDFGLAKVIETTHVQVTTVIGTRSYLAPEWFLGTITQAADIYSYGIVLLEVLTGLPAQLKLDCGDMNIKHYIEQWRISNDVGALLDDTIKHWNKWREMFHLADECTQQNLTARPTADKICYNLRSWLNTL